MRINNQIEEVGDLINDSRNRNSNTFMFEIAPILPSFPANKRWQTLEKESMNFVDRFDQPPSNNLRPDILIRVVKDCTSIREIFPKNT